MTPKRHVPAKDFGLASPREKDDDHQQKSQAFRYVKRRRKLCRGGTSLWSE